VTDSAGPPPRPEDADLSRTRQFQTPAAGGYGWRRPEIPVPPAITPAESAAPATHASQQNVLSANATTLRLARIDPWSVTQQAFAISIALMIVAVVAAAVLWIMLAMSGFWSSINTSMGSVLADGSESFDITDYLGFGRVVGGALVLAAINVVFMTALAAIGAHLYNLVAAMLGGVEVTLAEDTP
jgi:hypothetical protein